MLILSAWATVILITIFGVTMNLALANWLNRNYQNSNNDYIDRLLSSILPGLAMVGGLATLLGALHLFRIEVVLPLALIIMVWLRQEFATTVLDIKKLLSLSYEKAQRGNPILIIVILILFVLFYVVTISSMFPSPIADVWVFNIPLAQSIIENHGLVSPQIGHPFYGNIPMFFQVLFACAMLFADHWFSANIVNAVIFFGFAFLLTTCASRWRGAGFLFVVLLLVVEDFFSGSAAQPMTDLPRSCFAIASVLFLWRYLETHRPVELMQCALVLGGAVGSKYTELQMLGLIGAVLLPLIVRRKISLSLFVMSIMGFMSIAAYWYIKNLIVLGNPVYPFFFAHPGLTDEWMADYKLELGRAFDPENRRYVTNLATIQGWRDFLFILYNWFIAPNPIAMLAIVLIVGGLLAAFRRIILLVVFTSILFVVWYSVMFNHIRWAMPAYLLFFSTAYIGASLSRERLDSWIDQSLAPRFIELAKRSFVFSQLSKVSLIAIFALMISGIGTIAVLKTVGRWQLDHGSKTDLYLGRLSVDRYLESNLDGYKIYRYIAKHDLKSVFQPFDTSSTVFATAYADGIDGKWMVPSSTLPKNEENIEEYLAQENIRYFITVSMHRQEFLAERIGKRNFEMAGKIIDHMKPHSTLLLEDESGWQLYRYEREKQ